MSMINTHNAGALHGRASCLCWSRTSASSLSSLSRLCTSKSWRCPCSRSRHAVQDATAQTTGGTEHGVFACGDKATDTNKPQMPAQKHRAAPNEVDTDGDGALSAAVRFLGLRSRDTAQEKRGSIFEE